jgi:D-tyrosyl-tRNA(Tyr) deacylase
MRAIVQRVLAARVVVSGQTVGKIERGLVVFLGFGKGDATSDADHLVEKILGLRIFEDGEGKMNRALVDVSGGLLIISQFTLYGDVTRGRRPSFDQAMPPKEAEELYERFVSLARAAYPQIETGRFGADMQVTVENDGPVTLIVEVPPSANSQRRQRSARSST